MAAGRRAWPELAEQLAAALLWACATVKFGGSTTVDIQSFTDAELLGMFLMVGANGFAFLLVGVLGSVLDCSLMFGMGTVLAVLAWTFDLTATAVPSAAPLALVSVFLTVSASAVLTMAWCERTARREAKTKRRLQVTASLLAASLVPLLSFLPASVRPSICNTFICLSGLLAMLMSARIPNAPRIQNAYSGIAHSQKADAAVGLILFAFGALETFLYASAAFAGDLLPPSNGSPLWPWGAFAATCALCLYLVWKPDLQVPSGISIAVPFLVLAILLAPSLGRDAGDAVWSIAAFVSVCSISVWSSGFTEERVSIAVGSLELTFWKRSWFMVGLVAGYIAGVLANVSGFGLTEPSSAFVMVLVYAVLGLTTSIVAMSAFAPSPETEQTEIAAALETPPGDEDATNLASFARRYELTERETQIVSLVLEGRDRPYIMNELCLSRGTVNTHFTHIYSKTMVHGRQELINLARKNHDLK